MGEYVCLLYTSSLIFQVPASKSAKPDMATIVADEYRSLRIRARLRQLAKCLEVKNVSVKFIWLLMISFVYENSKLLLMSFYNRVMK